MSNDQNSGGVMRRWTTGLLVAAILYISFYGCGLVTKNVVITYHPEENVIRFEEAGNVAIKVTVNDLRTKASDLGTEKEVGDVPAPAPINTNSDLKELVGYAIETELTNRGFKSGEEVWIEVDLIKFYTVLGVNPSASYYQIFTANLILHVDVKKPDGTLVYSNLVRGKGTNNIPLKRFPKFVYHSIASLERYSKASLDRALKDGISKLVNDPEFIKSLIKASMN